MTECIECKRRTNFIEKEFGKCRLCSWPVCKTCSIEVPANSTMGPSVLCTNYCLRVNNMSRMNLSELQNLPVKSLKEYTKAYGISTAGIFEKDDLAKLISTTKVTEENLIVLKMNRSAAAASNPTNPNPPPASSSTNDSSQQRTSSASAGPSEQRRQNPDPVSNFFRDVGKGFHEISTAFQEVGEAIKEAVSPIKKRARNENTAEQPIPSPSAPPQTPNNAASGSTYPDATYAAPSSTNASPTHLSSDIDPPSLTTIASTNLDLNTLSTKALKRILLRERVSTLDINDREELLRRVRVLVDNVGKELAESANEDNLCKVCCERPINCVLLECGHLCVCIDCGEQLSKSTHECPICRARITRIIHTFKA